MASKYGTVLENAKADFINLLESTEGWTVVKTYGKEKEVIMESKPSETNNCNIFRSTVMINAPLKVVDETFPLCPFTAYKEWSPDVSDVILLESLEDGAVVFQITTPRIARVISPRSFIVVGKSEKEDVPIILRYGISTDYDKPVKEDGMVRGINGPYGIKMAPNPLNPNQTRAELITQTDFQGRIPRKILDAVVPTSLVNSLECYKTYLKQKGLVEG